MAPCFIGDAGGATQLPQEAVRCFLLGCFVRFCSWCLLRFGPLSPGFAPPSPFLLVGPLPSGPVSALLVLRASGCICNCICWSITARSIALALASTRMRKLWYGVLWLIGSCLHSSSWQQRLRPCPVWALRSTPCWGCCSGASRSCTEVFALG